MSDYFYSLEFLLRDALADYGFHDRGLFLFQLSNEENQ